MFVTSYNKAIERDNYFEISYQDSTTAYVITGIDVNSTPAVVYVTADSSYIRDKSADNNASAQSAANFWISGGNN
jgi:uncharacterized protein YpmB